MKILTIRTDKPEAELGWYDDKQQLSYMSWLAHRELSETIHTKIKELLNKSSNRLEDIEGIIVFKGPGSFTGLRIGITLANILAYALEAPIVAADGEDWISEGIKMLLAGKNNNIALPEYGAAANVTIPKK